MENKQARPIHATITKKLQHNRPLTHNLRWFALSVDSWVVIDEPLYERRQPLCLLH